MFIFIDKDNNIKAINSSIDESLTCIEIDREEVFPNFTDFMILNYKYIKEENGYTICPSSNYDELLYLENKELIKEHTNKISVLEEEQIVQNDDILTSMLATSEIFEMVLNMTGATINIKNKNAGGNSMVELYVTLILKGAKTIDQVPAIIRPQVQEQLDLVTN